MRKNKYAKQADKKFWSNFFYFNIPAHLNEVPEHINRVNFRYYYANDHDLLRMVEVVKSIDQLDLDETDITNKGIEYLTRLEKIKEIRLKGCSQIDNQSMPLICSLNGLEVLHLIGTAVTTDGFSAINQLKYLKILLISADKEDFKLEEIYANLAPNCELIVNYKAYPFVEE